MTDASPTFTTPEKPKHPWFKRKRIIIPGVLLAVIIVGNVAGGTEETVKVEAASGETGKSTASTTAAPEEKPKLFPGRVDSQKKDQELNVGESAKLSGYTTTVTALGFQQSVSEYENKGYVVAEVTIENRDEKTQAYNGGDWKIQMPTGQVIDTCFCGLGAETISYGDLVTGGKVSGEVIFEAPSKGDYYLIYDPDAGDSARGIWKVTV